MKLTIIEAAYSHSPDRMALYLVECVKDSLRRGESPISSVAMFALTGALSEGKPEDRSLGMRCGWEWYRKAELAAIYTDYGTSMGVLQGIEEARKHGVPIEYRQLYGPKVGGDRNGD